VIAHFSLYFCIKLTHKKSHMKLSTLRKYLLNCQEVQFILPNGTFVPAHFHLTELGKTAREFVDCGGVWRKEEKANMQLWVADDTDHRLTAEKAIKIIDTCSSLFDGIDLDLEIEYQRDTIGRFGLTLENGQLELTNLQTACLAPDSCGIPAIKTKVELANMVSQEGNSCTPGGGCC
jgi:hypothetical protein